MTEALTAKEIQVNVVLEESPTNRLNQQSVRMVGFVIINDPHIKLSDLRLKILSELDEQQLQITGLNFKFLKKTFPVSSKQETSMTLKKICVNLANTADTQSTTQNHNNQIRFAKETSRASSAPYTDNNSLIIANDDEKQSNNKMPPNKTNTDKNLNAMQPFEVLPHHYQYISSHLAPMIQHTNVSNTNTNNTNNQSAFPKVTMLTSQQTNEKETEYTVMIRACHSVFSVGLRRSVSDDVRLHSVLDIDNNARTSGSFNLKNTKKNTGGNAAQQISPNKNKKKESVNNKKEIDSTSFASFLSSYPISPKSTRLETQLGEKLPRIGPKTTNESQRTTPSNEVDSILKKAMLSRKNSEHINNLFISVDETEEESISISVNENTNLKKNDSLHPNCSIVPLKIENSNYQSNKALSTPPHTFVYSKQTLTKPANSASNSNCLIDDNIKCKFTVIGSPMINVNEDKKNNNNIVWEFEKEADLLKGLSGVHHSVTNPLWIDLVCDRNTFINIAEHIRPSIHNLTIEDCLTIDCREKLEIFKDYLFICLRTSSDDHSTTQTINILIFKTMIITYHLGHIITLSVMENVGFILKKKFGNICPSPSWICHTIIDNVIDKMMPEVESTVREVETCEQFVFKLCNESQNELLHRMQIARAWMVLYRSRLWPKSTITYNLLNNYLWRKDFLSDVPEPYWRDINDHVARMVDLLELGTQTLESIQNIFVAKVSLEMTQQSNNLAKVGGKLAGIGAVFLPLTVITGIWGMNCKVPFQYAPEANTSFDNNIYGFMVVMVIMLCSSIFTWKFVKKQMD